MRPIKINKGKGRFVQNITVGSHQLLADTLIGNGGEDQGPSPHEYLAASLGACTSMT